MNGLVRVPQPRQREMLLRYLLAGRAPGRGAAGWSDKGTGLLVLRIGSAALLPVPAPVAASAGGPPPPPPERDLRALRLPRPRRRPKRLRPRPRPRPKKNPNWSPNSTKSCSPNSDARAASASAAAAADIVASTDALAKSPRRKLRRCMRRPLLLRATQSGRHQTNQSGAAWRGLRFAITALPPVGFGKPKKEGSTGARGRKAVEPRQGGGRGSPRLTGGASKRPVGALPKYPAPAAPQS
jgi:hypothetical protein